MSLWVWFDQVPKHQKFNKLHKGSVQHIPAFSALGQHATVQDMEKSAFRIPVASVPLGYILDLSGLV